MKVEQEIITVSSKVWNNVKDDSMLINQMIRNRISFFNIDIIRWRAGYNGDDFVKDEISIIVNYIV